MKTTFFDDLFLSIQTSENIYSAVLHVTKELKEADCDRTMLKKFVNTEFVFLATDEMAAIVFRGLYFSPYTGSIMYGLSGRDFNSTASYTYDTNIRDYRKVIDTPDSAVYNSSHTLTYRKEYAFYHEMHTTLFKLMLSNNNKQEKKVNDILLATFQDGAGISADEFNACLKYIQASRVEQNILFAFLRKLNQEQQKEAYNAIVGTYSFDLSQLDLLSEENRLTAVRQMTPNTATVHYIRQNMQSSMEAYPKKAAQMLSSLYQHAHSDALRNSLRVAAKQLSHPAYLMIRMNAIDAYNYAYALYSPFAVKTVDCAKFDGELVESLIRYTDISYEFSSDDQKYTVRFDISDRHTILFSFYFDNDTTVGRISENHLVDICNTTELTALITATIEAVRRTYGEAYIRAREQAVKNMEEARKKRALDILQESMGTLSAELSLVDRFTTAMPKKQVLECNFEIINNACFVSFKIGRENGRRYVVKDAAAFIESFSMGTSMSYGKETFIHNREYFDAFSQTLLDFILLLPGTKNNNYYDAKSYRLTPIAAEKLLILFKGHSFSYDNLTYFMTEDAISCEVSVGDDYTIINSLSADNVNLISINRSLICLHTDSKQASFVAGDISYLKVIAFAYMNNGADIRPIADRFATDVYPAVRTKIRIGDTIREEFEKSILTIKAYFDYENESVTLRTELCSGNTFITPQNIVGPVNTATYQKYMDIIHAFGFRDGVLSGDDAYAFMDADLTDLKRVATVFISESLASKTVVKFVPKSIRIQYQNEMMTAFVDSGEFSDEDLASVIKAIRKKKKYVSISGNRIVRTDDSTALDFNESVEDLGLNTDHLTESQRITTAQSLRAFAHEKNCELNEYLREMMRAVTNFQTNDTPLPQLETTLPDYQKDGFRWMNVLSRYGLGGILADDMGLGKTVEIIALLQADKTEGPSLVVCPKSVVFNWKNEFLRFAPNMKVVEVYGNVQDRADQLNTIPQNEKTVYITSYDSLRNDIELYKIPFCYLILDEAQYIKNVSAQKSKSVKRLKACHYFALTGTPIENSVLDLWSIFDFIMPGYLENLTTFKSKYLKDERYHAKIVKSIAPFILRRTKENVLTGLPEKVERILSAEMTSAQRKLYEAEKKQARDIMRTGGRAFDVLPWLMRLRQICVDPSTYIDGYTGGSGKMDLMEEMVRQYVGDGRRILIFSQFVKALEIVRQRLNALNIGCQMITGSTPADMRIEIAQSFNAGNSVPVILISLKAGGTGLNLIGADTVIHLDPWWNVAAENQASDRAYRIGQTKNVEIIKLVCENTVEQKVIELQEIKKKVVDTFIPDDENSVISAKPEDISFILE